MAPPFIKRTYSAHALSGQEPMASLVSLSVVVCMPKVDNQRAIRLIQAWASFNEDSYVSTKHVFN
jgi:hypothetical protein